MVYDPTTLTVGLVVSGITVGHMLRCHPKPDRWKLKMYVPMLLAFFLGGMAGLAAFYKVRGGGVDGR
jgi:hypothetical protein